MTEGLAVLAACLLVAVSAWAFRRWGWPAVVAVWTGAVAIVASVAATVRRPSRAPSTAPDVHRARAEAREHQQAAERARQAAARIAADVDAAEDAEALRDHVVARSKGKT